MSLANHTESLYQRDRRRDDEKAHIIYLTHTHRDYCREDAPTSVATLEQAIAWANSHFQEIADSTARRAVTAFRVEWW